MNRLFAIGHRHLLPIVCRLLPVIPPLRSRLLWYNFLQSVVSGVFGASIFTAVELLSWNCSTMREIPGLSTLWQPVRISRQQAGITLYCRTVRGIQQSKKCPSRLRTPRRDSLALASVKLPEGSCSCGPFSGVFSLKGCAEGIWETRAASVRYRIPIGLRAGRWINFGPLRGKTLGATPLNIPIAGNVCAAEQTPPGEADVFAANERRSRCSGASPRPLARAAPAQGVGWSEKAYANKKARLCGATDSWRSWLLWSCF